MARIEELMRHETAGDPITGLKWTRRTTQKIANELESLSIEVSANTVARLLKDLGFSLRVNHKKISSGSPVDRDEQFAYIGELRERFASQGQPIVSVDTKKRELVGNFKNAGQTWNREPVGVKDHDFRSEADGIAIPYGIYDLQANSGAVFVGTTHDTPQFAVENLVKWWRYQGQRRYPSAKSLLFSPMAAAATVHACVPGNMLSRAVFVTDTASRLPSATTQREPRSGTLSNTASSVRSARTGQEDPSTATRQFSITSDPPPPQPASRSKPTSCKRLTRKELVSPINRWLVSNSTSIKLSPVAIMTYSPGSQWLRQNGKLFLSGP